MLNIPKNINREHCIFHHSSKSYQNNQDRINEIQTNYSILVIEDNLINQKVALAYLRELGQYKIDIAPSGKEALTLLKNNIYSLILLDIDLPDMSGFDICKAVKNSISHNSIPIIVTSAHHEKKIKDKCLSLGVNAFMTKPLDFEGFRQYFAIYLNNKQTNISIKNIKSDHQIIKSRIYEKNSS